MIKIDKINDILNNNITEDQTKIREVLSKAKEAKGLDTNDVAILSTIKSKILTSELFATAKEVKESIYGNRIVLFAPLYFSNVCVNNCLYCGFRTENKNLKRTTLTQAEIAEETKYLISEGHKRILLVGSEQAGKNSFNYILDTIDTIYSCKHELGEIRRLNVNIAPLTIDEFRQLGKAKIGTYQLFQETYNPKTYAEVHLSGPKADYNLRLTAIDKAIEGGINDIGIGVLFGLFDWRFEILALIEHANYLRTKYGIGPHTISVPRLEPASGSEFANNPPYQVNDDDFTKIVAILRLAIPSTGIIMSTRESPTLRKQTYSLGVSQISAGSCTNPGGYKQKTNTTDQFSLNDQRPLDEVVYDMVSMGYIPSFCTACYRSERTGKSFMHLADNGLIKKMCTPNALITFMEYLIDYASPKTCKIGFKFIREEIKKLPEDQRKNIVKIWQQLIHGTRDIYI